MRLAIIISVFIIVLFFGFGYCAQGTTFQGANTTIKDSQVYFIEVSSVPAVTGTTGQCIGILCGVTHAN